VKEKTLGDRVLVKMHESASKTKGGLHIPETAQKETDTGSGVVVAVSEKGRLSQKGVRIPPALKVGQSVMVKGWDGTEVQMDDVRMPDGTKLSGLFHVFREQDIVAVLEG